MTEPSNDDVEPSVGTGQSRQPVDDLLRRLRHGGEGAVQYASGFLERAKDGVSSAKDKVGGLLGAAWTRTGDATSAAVDWGRELPARVRELFVEDCSVPVLLLPTGPVPADFHCRFDFKEAVNELSNGVLVRPQLMVWAGRSDVDRDRLRRLLTDQFVTQLNEQRRQALENEDPRVEKLRTEAKALEKRQEKEGRKLGSSMGAVSAALIGMFLFANPLFDLLFLTMAFFGTGEVVKRFGPWFSATFSSTVSRKRVEREEQKLAGELEKDLAASSDAFHNAVGNLKVHVHPALQRLGQSFAEVELASFPAEEAETGQTPPRISTYLAEPDYIEQVPKHLLVLVEAQLDRE